MASQRFPIAFEFLAAVALADICYQITATVTTSTSTWKVIRSNVCEYLARVLTDDNEERVCKMQGENFTIH